MAFRWIAIKFFVNARFHFSYAYMKRSGTNDNSYGVPLRKLNICNFQNESSWDFFKHASLYPGYIYVISFQKYWFISINRMNHLEFYRLETTKDVYTKNDFFEISTNLVCFFLFEVYWIWQELKLETNRLNHMNVLYWR